MQSAAPAAGDRPDMKGAAYEEEHVHGVYQQIAQHFSSTRYKVCHSFIQCLTFEDIT